MLNKARLMGIIKLFIVTVLVLQIKQPVNTTHLHAPKNYRLERSTHGVDSNDLITSLQLQILMYKKKVTLIDVRENFEYQEEGSISGSINIPLKDLNKALKLSDKSFRGMFGVKKPSKDDCNIVLICSSGVRSDIAYKIAKDNGYKCPKSLKGGFDLLPRVGGKR